MYMLPYGIQIISPNTSIMKKNTIDIPADGINLRGDLTLLDQTKGLVIFSHGSGSSRLSPRNRFVAGELQKSGFATLLFDLLTPQEDTAFERRFDIGLLTQRLITTTLWIDKQSDYKDLNVGYFGASTGAASALAAAASLGHDMVKAIVSRGGRPDLATGALESVHTPTLLLVGGLDTQVIKLNEMAYEKLNCNKQLKIIPDASHLFEEPGKLEEVTRCASDWFEKYLYQYQNDIEKDFMD